MQRKSIALFTPLPPARTGTADYAAALLTELRKGADVEVFAKAPAGFKPAAYDAVIYQIANNEYHSQIYDAALRYPAIVVLHEANLHDLIRGKTAHDAKAYGREVVYEMFGQVPESIGTGDLAAGAQHRTFTMLRRLLDRSLACIVHSQFVATEVRRRGFKGKIFHIPHGVGVAAPDSQIKRAELRVAPGATLFGMFGYQRPDKQALECLAGFRVLLNAHPSCRLVIAGTPHPEVPLDASILELGLDDAVSVLGFQEPEHLDGLIAACDVVLNLRYPTFGETSGIAVRAFGMGKTVVVSDTGADREWPANICVKIPCDRHQANVLPEVLKWLVANPDAASGIGRNAARWSAENANWNHVAERYLSVAETYKLSAEEPPRDITSVEFVRRYLASWVKPESGAHAYYTGHENRLVRTLQLTPPGQSRDRILEMGCYLQITPALRDLSGYGEVRGCYLGAGGTHVKSAQSAEGRFFECSVDLFDCERDSFPYPDEYFSTILFCEILEHLRCDPMQALIEIHRVLRPGGTLLLTTPNVASLRSLSAVLRGDHPGFYSHYPDPDSPAASDPMHAREYTPVEISRLLTAAGFIVDHIETGPYGPETLPEAAQTQKVLLSLGHSVALRDECIFALGRKANLPRQFRPSWLYDCSAIAPETS